MAISAVSSSNTFNQPSATGSVKKANDPSAPKSASGKALSQDQQQEVEKLKKRDNQVRSHEQAHVAAGGAYIKGGVSFQYQKGPDGTLYAIGGEVSIDVSPVKNDPHATIAKMEAVQRAALAPADPSGADRSVAAAAAQAEAQAQQEISSYNFSGEKTSSSQSVSPKIDITA